MVRENEDKTSVADNMNQPTAKTSCDSDDMPDVGVGVFLHICLHNAILMDWIYFYLDLTPDIHVFYICFSRGELDWFKF